MLGLDSEEDLTLLRETCTIECKTAIGRDGRGKLPSDFWPTYSAFANTYGGTVLLGIKERDEKFEVVGIQEVEKIRKDLFNDLNNRQKVSANLLSDKDVTEHTIDGKTVIRIDIPRANRSQKPVHLTQNPLGSHTLSGSTRVTFLCLMMRSNGYLLSRWRIAGTIGF